jgi:hypothetical protein
MVASSPPELGEYAGESLLIVGHELGAHSKDFDVIVQAAEDKALLLPFVHYVPTGEEGDFLLSNR